jgi:hypothetical protein
MKGDLQQYVYIATTIHKISILPRRFQQEDQTRFRHGLEDFSFLNQQGQTVLHRWPFLADRSHLARLI